MSQLSAGILLYRERDGQLELLLVHPGGPFWAKKDAGVWSIPKGLVDENEDPLAAARREFAEETGTAVTGDFLDLGTARQPGGKIVHIWAVPGDLDPAQIHSNTFPLEWPPHSGRIQQFPEVDRGGWFSPPEARPKLVKGQRIFVDRLLEKLGDGPP